MMIFQSLLIRSHEWIFERTGIRQRHIASKDQMTSDLAYMSALDAIKDANINATDIDLIILATSTPDQVFPSTAVKLQDMLNIRDGAAFDIHAVCSGLSMHYLRLIILLKVVSIREYLSLALKFIPEY